MERAVCKDGKWQPSAGWCAGADPARFGPLNSPQLDAVNAAPLHPLPSPAAFEADETTHPRGSQTRLTCHIHHPPLPSLVPPFPSPLHLRSLMIVGGEQRLCQSPPQPECPLLPPSDSRTSCRSHWMMTVAPHHCSAKPLPYIWSPFPPFLRLSLSTLLISSSIFSSAPT